MIGIEALSASLLLPALVFASAPPRGAPRVSENPTFVGTASHIHHVE